MKKIIAIIFIFTLVACEKEVNIKLSDSVKKIVVEGVIEYNEVPYVILTKSVGFFDKIDFNAVQYVKGAVVTVEDINTSKMITLKEYSLDTTIGNQKFSYSIYGPDFNDPNAMKFKGEFNHTYRLGINYNNEYFESIASMPENPGLDSIWLEPVKGKEDSFKLVRAIYVDPDTFGNCVRLLTQTKRYIKNGKPELFFSSFNTVYDDDIINGTKLPLSIYLGYDKTQNIPQNEFANIGYVRKGDTVTIKWSAIDKRVFKFWETLSFSASSVGNPFASPVQVETNVKGALGVWGAYGNYFYTIIDSIK